MIPLLSNSQSISNEEKIKGDYRTEHTLTYMDSIPRGTMIGTADSAGNMYIHMHIEDAKIFLTDLLDYELLVDSVLPEYEREAALHSQAIFINIEKIKRLQSKNNASEQQVKNLEKTIENLREIGGFKDMSIEEAKKKVKKEQIKKGLGIGGGALGGVAVGVIIGFFLAK